METVIYHWWIFINLFAVVLTVYDKIAAKTSCSRVSERSLLTVGFLGGALLMLATMKLIRHKTKHTKFMVLLPLMVLLHIGIVLAYFFLI